MAAGTGMSEDVANRPSLVSTLRVVILAAILAQLASGKGVAHNTFWSSVVLVILLIELCFPRIVATLVLCLVVLSWASSPLRGGCGGWQCRGAAAFEIDKLSIALESYRADLGRFPSSEEGLQALIIEPPGAATWGGPYLQKPHVIEHGFWTRVLEHTFWPRHAEHQPGPYVDGAAVVDRWDWPYLYRMPSARQGYDYDVCSYGPDGPDGKTGQTPLCNSDERLGKTP